MMLFIIDVYNAKIKNIEMKHPILPTFNTTNTTFKAKIKNTPVDLSKLSDVVKNDVVKKDIYI